MRSDEPLPFNDSCKIPEIESNFVFRETTTCPLCGVTVSNVVTVCPNDGTSLVTPIASDPVFKDKYLFLGTLGSGGMGVIYRAKHVILDKEVAVKTLHAHVKNEEAFRRFQLEGKAASALKHPNLVTVYDFGVTQDAVPYMVMEYVQGITLDSKLESGEPLSDELVCSIFLQILDGLEHAHEHNVVHRDIKPSNVMLVPAGNSYRVMIMDFGIAKIVTPDGANVVKVTQTGELIGSPAYMSPEQVRGQDPDGRSDLYSLGCMMYESLTGRPPFLGKTQIETLMMQASEVPTPPSKLPSAKKVNALLEGITLKLLAKNPDDRFQSVKELREAFHSDSLIKVQLTKAPVKAGREKFKKKLKMIAICATAAVSVCALGAITTNLHRDASQSLPDIAKQDVVSIDNQATKFMEKGDYDTAANLLKAANTQHGRGVAAHMKSGDNLAASQERFLMIENYRRIGHCDVVMAQKPNLNAEQKERYWQDAVSAYTHVEPYYFSRITRSNLANAAAEGYKSPFESFPVTEFVHDYKLVLEHTNNKERLKLLNKYASANGVALF